MFAGLLSLFAQLFVVLSIVFLFVFGLLCVYCVKMDKVFLLVVNVFLNLKDCAIVLVRTSLCRRAQTIVLPLDSVLASLLIWSLLKVIVVAQMRVCLNSIQTQSGSFTCLSQTHVRDKVTCVDPLHSILLLLSPCSLTPLVKQTKQ